MQLIDILNLINKIAIIMLTISLIIFFYRLIYIIFGFLKPKKFKETNKLGKYAILVPARDESEVIENLLISIKKQTYDKDFFDVYVITETEDDPTNSIVKSYGYNVFIRRDLENKHTKGYALDEVVKDIYSKNLVYDAFFIIDADNIIAKNYLEEMNKAYFSGIDVAMSYKNVSNISDNWISCCSGLLFSNINTFQNKAKTRIFKTMLISGTGFYISNKILSKFKSFPFTTLTEDYEFSNYLILNKTNVAYVESTEVYVQQAVKLSTVNNQRTRWVKGYLNTNKKLRKKTFKQFFNKNSNKLGILENKFSLLPNVTFIVSTILYCLALLGVFVASIITQNLICFKLSLFYFFRFLLIYQLALSFYTLLQFIAERKHINISYKQMIIVLLLNPFFINLFIFQALKAIFSKNVNWVKIERIQTNNESVEDFVDLEEESIYEVKNG